MKIVLTESDRRMVSKFFKNLLPTACFMALAGIVASYPNKTPLFQSCISTALMWSGVFYWSWRKGKEKP